MSTLRLLWSTPGFSVGEATLRPIGGIYRRHTTREPEEDRGDPHP
jgi:hypothetical protein